MSGSSGASLPPVPFTKLYTYATTNDIVMNVVACLSAAASGCILPLFSLVFGSALNILNDPTSKIVEEVSKLALYFLLIAIGAGLLSFLEVSLTVYATESQMRRLRTSYVRSLLYQDSAWYDTHRAGESVARLAEATITVGSGMEKVASVLRYTATLFAGLAIGFSTSWKLTLVIMGCAPLFAIALSILIITAISSEKAERTAYARAGDAASEVFGLIRAVAAYGGEAHEGGRYLKFLRHAEAAGIRKGVGIGTAVGLMLLSFYAMYGISTWAGAQFVIQSRADQPACRFNPTLDGCFSGGDIITTFVSVLLGALSFGQVGPLMGNISAARAAAADLFGVIDAVPTVNVQGGKGHTGAAGGADGGVRIEFKDVTFAYPSRPDVQVMKDFSLTIEPGENIGVVGGSGSGKSTLALLVLRQYDVQSGAVLVDGVNVKDWNVSALRAIIGLVSQDPVLFGDSISRNIAMGKSVNAGPASHEEIVEAATAANAHGFIMQLPQGFDTSAGTGVSSSQLSGGQRQRVCIARALIRKPRVMLLDEATSALDTQSERLVQAALDTVAVGGKRTTVQVAHRLSTLVGVDRIIVMKSGRIVEQGAPAVLLANPDSVFFTMKATQDIADSGPKQDASTRAAEFSAAVTSSSVEGITTSLPDGDIKDSHMVVRSVNPIAARKTAPEKAASAPINLRSRLYSLQKEDLWVLFFGVLGAAGSGCIQPVVSIVYGDIIAIFFIPNDEEMKTKSLEYMGYFFLLGGCSLAGVLCRPTSYFDNPDNSVGRLGTRLATDAALVKGASGDSIGSIIEGCGAIIAALVISFLASWRLALVLLVVFPFLILGSIYEFKSVAQVSKGNNTALEDAGNSVSEAVTAFRTVSAYSLQNSTLEAYSTALDVPLKAGLRRGVVQAVGQAFQRFTLLCAYSLAFYAGSRFIELNMLAFPELIRTFLAITLAAEAVGRIAASAPDTAKADTAARAIFSLIDLGAVSPIDPMSTEGTRPVSQAGVLIEFKNVTFAYPSRPDIKVLDNFSITIEPGQCVGIVGSSGSGKSTLALLVLRAYDVHAGAVLVDGVNVKDWNVSALRSAMGLVQQEPALFADSISYNIAYGTPGPVKMAPALGVQPKETGDSRKEGQDSGDKLAKEASTEDTLPPKPSAVVVQDVHVTYPPPPAEVVDAARSANAAGFIAALPDEYASYCGSRGGQLSGGQKQRVAIARALLRKPRLLLLDEATSALDSESERIVQEALDAVLAEGRKAANDGGSAGPPRTSLVIAHRLSTLANADRIVVLDKGQVVEDGTHNALMAMPNGRYRALAMAQAGGGSV